MSYFASFFSFGFSSSIEFVEILTLTLIALLGAFLSPLIFAANGDSSSGTYVNLSTVPFLFTAIFFNVYVGILFLFISEIIIWRTVGRYLSIFIVNVVISIFTIVAANNIFHYFDEQKYSALFSSSAAVVIALFFTFILQVSFSFAKYRTLRFLLPSLNSLGFDFYLLFAALVSVAAYAHYDFFLAAVVMLILVAGVALLVEWFLQNEKLMMSLQSEVAGVMRFALRDDIRRFPGIIEHAYRVSVLAGEMAREQGQSAQKQRYLKICGLVHEAGTIETLKNSVDSGMYTNLDPEVTKHALQSRLHGALTTGGILLADLRSYGPVDQVLVAHRERPDGSGYPYSLFEEQIPDDALLLGVANEFDVLTTIGIVDSDSEPLDLFASEKVIRKPLTARKAIEYLKEHSGTCFSYGHVLSLEKVIQQRNYQLFEAADAEQIVNGHVELIDDVRTRRLAQGPISYLIIKMFGLPGEAGPPVVYQGVTNEFEVQLLETHRLRRQTVLGKIITDKLEKRYRQQQVKHQQRVDQEIERFFSTPDLSDPVNNDGPFPP